jgi:hypothetical protein
MKPTPLPPPSARKRRVERIICGVSSHQLAHAPAKTTGAAPPSLTVKWRSEAEERGAWRASRQTRARLASNAERQVRIASGVLGRDMAKQNVAGGAGQRGNHKEGDNKGPRQRGKQQHRLEEKASWPAAYHRSSPCSRSHNRSRSQKGDLRRDAATISEGEERNRAGGVEGMEWNQMLPHVG